MTTTSRLRSWYSDSVPAFLSADPDVAIASLTRNSEFDISATQRDAWIAEIDVLRRAVIGLQGHIFLEFVIPRMGSRADAILIVESAVVVIEFKVGADQVTTSDINQVWDYALDLKNFHEGSHGLAIVPILVATEIRATQSWTVGIGHDGVARPSVVSSGELGESIRLAAKATQEWPLIRPIEWAQSSYKPTPTIIEAARALYAQHAVEEIARHDAGANNLRVTSRRVESLIEEARANRRKIICFVTGVPGAGKTLVGLNVATQRSDQTSATHAVFLSGNGPLVAVLREALTRDELARRRSQGEKIRKGDIANSVKSFIQNVHHFRDEALIDPTAPDDRVAIFDEAQRAWNRQKTSNFMRRRKNRPDFNQSEPEFLISYMDRHPDWAVIVCLVGGGQEINTGEAGIGEWLMAIENHFPHWQVFLSPNLADSEYRATELIAGVGEEHIVNWEPELHLAVSMRSYRAENVSAFVKTLLDCDAAQAEDHLRRMLNRFPTAITRDIGVAKNWIRDHARGSERYGLVASSRAMRLKPHAIDVRLSVDPIHWFLDEPMDPRSSYFLEDAATEFQVQGLELDWVCVSWDADLRKTKSGWSYHDFRGSRWINVRDSNNQNYLRNAYRVLLTRARQGMVIFVPPGESLDATRTPAYYDATFDYLAGLGLPVIG